jgi:aspartate/methionine/tyrosine aminotransferase
MNDKIKQLAEQAGQLQLATPDNPSADAIMVLIGPNIEKFAELIVKECADICMEMATKCAGLPGDGALAKDCADWIKKDFGVDE